tara:strand:- start:697 stop:1419 length:723 start_codon:yes stop_codon:yes gene_type:complete
MLIDLEVLLKEFDLKVSNIAHIGANLGQEVNVYNKIFPNSHIYLVEPQPQLCNSMQKEFKDMNNVTVLNTALGNKSGLVQLNLSPSNLSSSSILNPTFHKEIHPEIKFEGQISVPIEKYKKMKFKNVNFLNIDTQGYELEVLKGVGEYFNYIDYLLLEINTKELYAESPLLKDIDKYLFNLGYQRVVTVYWDKNCYWGDAFYIKKNLLKNQLILKNKIKNYIFKSTFLYNFFKKIRSTFI